MKKFHHTFIAFLLLLVFSSSFISCEDVVNVPLTTAAPRLVIDASINWEKGTQGNYQRIRLSTTTSFYDQQIPAVSNAVVFITNSQGQVFNFIENPENLGIYECFDFVPMYQESYELTVVADGQTYTATETLIQVPEIIRVEQSVFNGFGGEATEVKFFFQDNGMTNDFYLIEFKEPTSILIDFGVINDRFFQGNEMFGLYISDDIQAGDILNMKVYSTSETFFNYMNILLSIAGNGGGGGPFQTPPATLRGNIVNQTNFSQYALGFFRVSEFDTLDYEIE
jgi:hypothetical protein